ncbi:scp-like extracellular protein [Rutstroemia sp. NJR-2017a WRK4]|nr:scp-like extracellular protein [Rutstroemia sp. NJR-2017a WRK4]
MHAFTPLSLFLLLTPFTTAASTITITTSAAPQPTSSSYTSDSQFQSDMLKAHNFYRSEQNVSNLVWNDTSATYAKNWSRGCVFQHSGGPLGENLASGYANASASIDAWGLERKHYNYDKPGFSEKTGHFTQLVWSNTTSVGCGRTECDGKNGTPGWYVVCEYWPEGNVVGTGDDKNIYFKENVKEQTKGKAGDTVESGVSETSGCAGWRGGRGNGREGVVAGVMGVLAVVVAGLMF